MKYKSNTQNSKQNKTKTLEYIQYTMTECIHNTEKIESENKLALHARQKQTLKQKKKPKQIQVIQVTNCVAFENKNFIRKKTVEKLINNLL